MSVKKRGTTWQYDFYHDDKRYRKSGFKTKREATMAENERLNQLTKGFHLNDDVSFSEYFRSWTDARGIKKSKSTKYTYKLASDIIKKYFEGTPLNRVTRPKYQDFLNWYGMEAPNPKNKKGHSKSTLMQINSLVRACVNDAIFEGMLYKDFTYKVKLNYLVEEQKSEEKYMEAEDFKKLKRATVEDKTFVNFFFFMLIVTGGRYSDVIDMQYTHINDLQNEIFLNGTKTDTAARTVKVSKDDMLVIQDYLKLLPRNMRGLVFRRKGVRIHQSSFNRDLKILCNRLGVKKITQHAIRHTHSSILIKEGVSIDYISKRLGHKDIMTTQKTYSHLLQDMKKVEESKATQAIAEL